jgi:hypothetical protein
MLLDPRCNRMRVPEERIHSLRPSARPGRPIRGKFGTLLRTLEPHVRYFLSAAESQSTLAASDFTPPSATRPPSALKLTHSTSMPLSWQSQGSSSVFDEFGMIKQGNVSLPAGASPPNLAFRPNSQHSSIHNEDAAKGRLRPPSLTPGYPPGGTAGQDDSYIPMFQFAPSAQTATVKEPGSAPVENRWSNVYMQPPPTHARTASEPALNLRTTPLHVLQQVSVTPADDEGIQLPGSLPSDPDLVAAEGNERKPTPKKSVGDTMRRFFGRK